MKFVLPNWNVQFSGKIQPWTVFLHIWVEMLIGQPVKWLHQQMIHSINLLYYNVKQQPVSK